MTDHKESSLAKAEDSFEFIVPANQKGVRLDQFLVQSLSDIARAQILRSNKAGLLFVNGSVKKSSYKLKAGDSVSGSIYFPPPTDLLPQKVDFDILFEDEHLLVISKPPGLVVHPGSGNVEKTLVNGLLYHCQAIGDVGDETRPGIVHRLDKDTSGIMVIAKSDLVLRKLVDSFRNRQVHKVYYALVKGVVPCREDRIVAPIGRHPVNRQKMAVSERTGKFAASNYQLVEELTGDKSDYCLVRVNIETGRTHQIRVHMAHIGNPVAGDTVYGRKQSGISFPRQMLHSSELRFNHPISGKSVTLTAPLWPDILDALEQLGWSGSLE